MSKNYWNYRVFKHTEADGSVHFDIHSVYYTDDKPTGWSVDAPNPFGGDDIAELAFDLKLMGLALEKPMLEEYKDGEEDKVREVK